MSHDYIAIHGLPGMPCAMCARMEASHEPRLPLARGTRLDHNDLIRLLGHCDGRCGGHRGEPLSHNDRVRLFGVCEDRECRHR